MVKQIHSMAELVADIEKRLNNGDKSIQSALKNKNGQSFVAVKRDELRKAAEALEGFLTERLEDYFHHYSPMVYQRTGKLLNSIKSELTNENGKLKAVVYFDDTGAIRDSLWDDQPQSYLPALINTGWSVSKGWHKGIPHFGYFGGTNFINWAIREAKVDPRFENIEIIPHLNSPF